MGTSNKYLAVISVLEGRSFPKRSKHKIIVEAKFDGELLATDPVLHSEVTDFNQELAWELDRKALQQHRLQRSSIKIQCYAYDTETTMKESVGYVVMDLRSAAVNKQTPKWYPLLSSKYHKMKPELKLALYLDENPGDDQQLVPQKDTAPSIPTNVKTLVPVLNEEDGHYQIGPTKACTEEFVLSVTIAYGTNLAQLIPSSTPLQASNGFFFYYSLLGNDVTNEPFTNLTSPNFPAERASVKVRSSVEILRAFFSHQPGLQIHLCCGDQSLGNCDLPLTSLLKDDSTEIYMRPVTIEGSFQLCPANKPKSQVASGPGSLSPCVGVSVVLRKEDLAVKSPSKEGEGAALVTGVPPNVEGKAESPRRGKKSQAVSEKEQKKPEAQYSDDSFEESEDNSKAGQSEAALPLPPQASQPQQRPVHPQASLTSNIPADRMSVPPQAHHFTFSIDLRSIRDNHHTHTINVYLRYVYPFFGSAAPILTHPPVEIRKGSEVLLPQSFCAFDFACNMQQLQDTFARVPLSVEVWHRDRQLSQDVLIGSARLPLSLVVAQERSRMMSSAGVTGWRQEASDRVTVAAADGSSDKCADISLVLSLEDWGPIVPSQQASQAPQAPSLQAPVLQAAAAPAPSPPNPPSSPRATAEYQAAVELEVWKDSQEKDFDKKLKAKETSYMKALAEEWKKRDTEREVLMQKKLSEYQQMEDQLRKTLTDLERREKRLAVNEAEVKKLREDLQREHDRKLQEMMEASRRMKEDCDHQVELQKMKAKEIEDITNRYKQELAESEKKSKTMEREFQTYKDNQQKTPEVRLQTELNLINMEKLELERKLDAAAKSKAHYKQQWGRALKEVARLKQQEQEVAKAGLQRQQQELEQMRLRYLAAEEKEVVTKESRELDDIRNEINKLKLMEEERLRNTGDSNTQLPYVRDAQGKPFNMDLDASVDEHVSRLVEERDTLLRTGVYTTQDKIIMELERQIRDAVGGR